MVPDQIRAEHDAIAMALSAQYPNVLMPNLGLGEGDVATLITYLEAQNTALQSAAKHRALPAQ
jgi:hypothetical protein